ncbi:hypothetical protein ASF52_15810 [Methylobacterium sp. Leaf112]|nr:hypothetical protein ASF52_15810 [Methylobacterium sp. Leaf112]
MARLAAFFAGLRSPLAVVGKVATAGLSALVASLRSPLRVVGEVAATGLSALVPGFRGTFPIFGEVAGSTAMLGLTLIAVGLCHLTLLIVW